MLIISFIQFLKPRPLGVDSLFFLLPSAFVPSAFNSTAPLMGKSMPRPSGLDSLLFVLIYYAGIFFFTIENQKECRNSYLLKDVIFLIKFYHFC